ncbi:hypothetical protein BD769DRAFT_1444614, partial [Suillus cothurnatus]
MTRPILVLLRDQALQVYSYPRQSDRGTTILLCLDIVTVSLSLLLSFWGTTSHGARAAGKFMFIYSCVVVTCGEAKVVSLEYTG